MHVECVGGIGYSPGMGVTKAISSVPLISLFFNIVNTGYLLNIMFIFDRCCRSSAAVTPVKYQCDVNNITGTFARSKILLTDKLTNGALVTPIPVLCTCWEAVRNAVTDCITDSFCRHFLGEPKSNFWNGTQNKQYHHGSSGTTSAYNKFDLFIANNMR